MPAGRLPAAGERWMVVPVMRSRWMEMAVYAIQIFGNDGTIDEHELDCLLALANDDGQIDADERRVLGNILDRVDPLRVPELLWMRIGCLRAQLAI